MVVGVIQSNYIPWRGYFDFINSVDLFLIYDNVQYSSGTYRNRNQIRSSATDKMWLTLPLARHHLGTNIDQIQMSPNEDWAAKHLESFKKYYHAAPYFQDAYKLFTDGLQHKDTYLSDLNVRLIKSICHYLQITTKIELASQYEVQGHSTERLVHLLKQVHATKYISGPSGGNYLNNELFQEAGIELEFKKYNYKPYPQVFEGFDGNVSVLDLIACVGPKSADYLQSQEL